MAPRTKPADWSRKLSPAITLRDGRNLVTLGDASEVLFTDLKGLRSPALNHAVELVNIAARSGKAADRIRATEQVERVLRFSLMV